MSNRYQYVQAQSLPEFVTILGNLNMPDCGFCLVGVKFFTSTVTQAEVRAALRAAGLTACLLKCWGRCAGVAVVVWRVTRIRVRLPVRGPGRPRLCWADWCTRVETRYPDLLGEFDRGVLVFRELSDIYGVTPQRIGQIRGRYMSRYSPVLYI